MDEVDEIGVPGSFNLSYTKCASENDYREVTPDSLLRYQRKDNLIPLLMYTDIL